MVVDHIDLVSCQHEEFSRSTRTCSAPMTTTTTLERAAVVFAVIVAAVVVLKKGASWRELASSPTIRSRLDW